jgi:cellulose synthase/poly-beta-1,6-N-acetylglucosamine synthase-like glycosyltransferase
MCISVLVPSYRRAQDLRRCLAAIAGQRRAPEQVLVVARKGDTDTFTVLSEWQTALRLEVIEVEMPGQVHALNAGLARCTGDAVAITDDDAAPRPEWLARIERHFASDSRIGGVGGRDWIHRNGILDVGHNDVVGRIRWFGRVAGNHHLGNGRGRDVDILKGANCAFRMTAIRPIGFDVHLLGAGAQVHNDMVASLALKKAGWRLIYDPQVSVDHYMSERADSDRRSVLQLETIYQHAFNMAIALDHIPAPMRRRAAKLWQILMGSRSEPGIVWALRLVPSYGVQALRFWRSAAAGRHAAWSKTQTRRAAL